MLLCISSISHLSLLFSTQQYPWRSNQTRKSTSEPQLTVRKLVSTYRLVFSITQQTPSFHLDPCVTKSTQESITSIELYIRDIYQVIRLSNREVHKEHVDRTYSFYPTGFPP